jgi:hypothetical protein
MRPVSPWSRGSPLPAGGPGPAPIPGFSEHTCDPARQVQRLGVPLRSPRLHVVGPPHGCRSQPCQRLGEVRPLCPLARLRPRDIQHRRHLGEPYEVVRLLSHVEILTTPFGPQSGQGLCAADTRGPRRGSGLRASHEPAEHRPDLRGEGDFGGRTDEEAERQPDHRAERDCNYNAHADCCATG